MGLVKIFFVIFSLAVLGCAKGIDKKYQTNANCQACHLDISKKWEISRHSYSHFTKNQLYNNVLDFIVTNNIVKTKEEVVVECAKCHNPRIDKREVSDVDKLGMLLDIDKKTMDKMINTAYMKNGINCIVCHNVMEIEANSTKVGFDAVKFGPQGVMYGPFQGAKSPYHLTKKRDFFKTDPNSLCMVCHKRGFNEKGVKVYATGEEYEDYRATTGKDVASCVECHMSGEKRGIASNYKGHGGMVERLIRDHIFASVDNIEISKISKKYINLHTKLLPDGLKVTISNLIPHKVPTGYGLREVELAILFYDKNEKLIKKRSHSFSADWLDEHGKSTIPHLAVKQGEDRRLSPLEVKKFIFSIPKNTKIINYKLIYRQVKRDFIKKLNITDRFFKKEFILKNGVIEPQ